ncbi:MAG: sporulation integral membrane protein YtvI [Lachnospiraceae bacterium]|nr:sporulation integral membrane protein YtvI [Lachnospiraceae bacterium]
MEQKKKFIINTVFWGIILMIIFSICRYLLPVLIPFMIAFLIATLIQTVVKKTVGKLGIGKKPAAIGACVIFWVAVFLLIAVSGNNIIQGIEHLIQVAPGLYDNKIVPFMDDISKALSIRFSAYDINISLQIQNMMSEFTQNIGQYISSFSMKAVTWLSHGAKEIPGAVIQIVITVIATFFMAADYEEMRAAVKMIIPEGRRTMVSGGVKYVKSIIAIYLKSYTILFSVTFVELAIGLSVLRIPYAVLVALCIAVFDVLPILGTGGVLLPWAVILFVIGKSPLGIGVLVIYLIITVVRNILEPRIVGKQIGLHPLLMLICLFVGLKLLGLAGMILLPVSASVLMGMYKSGVLKRPEIHKGAEN